MSHKAIADFVARVESDNALRTRLNEIGSQGNWVPGTMEVAKELGYDFNQDELQSYIEEHYSDDLSEEMLDKIAGGTTKGGW